MDDPSTHEVGSEPLGQIQIQQLPRGELLIESQTPRAFWILTLLITVIVTVAVVPFLVMWARFLWPVVLNFRYAVPLGAVMGGVFYGPFLFFLVYLFRILFFVLRNVPVERNRRTTAHYGTLTTRAHFGRSRSVSRQQIDNVYLIPVSIGPQKSDGLVRLIAAVRNDDGSRAQVPLTAPTSARDDAVEALRLLRVQLGADTEGELELEEHISPGKAFEARLKGSVVKQLAICVAVTVSWGLALALLFPLERPEPTASQAEAEKQEDADPEIVRDGGIVTYTGSKAVERHPDWAPVYPDAPRDNHEQYDKNWYTNGKWTFSSEDSLLEIQDFYRQQCRPEEGWYEKFSNSGPNHSFLTLERVDEWALPNERHELKINLQRDGDATNGSLRYEYTTEQ